MNARGLVILDDRTSFTSGSDHRSAHDFPESVEWGSLPTSRLLGASDLPPGHGK